MYSDKTKRSFNFQIVESSEDMMDLKSEAANKLDMVLEVSEVPSQGNDKYKVKFDELKVLLNEDEIEQNLADDNNQNSEKEDSEKSNDNKEEANMIENDYKEEVDKRYKGKMNYEAEEEIDEIAEFDEIEDEETSVIEKRRKKKSKCETSRNSENVNVNLETQELQELLQNNSVESSISATSIESSTLTNATRYQYKVLLQNNSPSSHRQRSYSPSFHQQRSPSPSSHRQRLLSIH
ncbi:24043_t:CDS:2 [Cetraspora pellucida]|uniref:24043_t:CDS:1 n=1 Tax=Cetraspora pellucida TaxID=1433469 RepID=A0A9N9HR73_9GLOM|nr:24043_t:CDS:2 [Cetraspora pellucida]